MAKRILFWIWELCSFLGVWFIPREQERHRIVARILELQAQNDHRIPEPCIVPDGIPGVWNSELVWNPEFMSTGPWSLRSVNHKILESQALICSPEYSRTTGPRNSAHRILAPGDSNPQPTES